MSSTPPQQPSRSGGDTKKVSPPSSIVTRNAARQAKIQTRSTCSGAKPSAALLAAKKKAQQNKKKQSVEILMKDDYQIAMESKNKVKGPTGFVTEPRMVEHRCLWDENYPECPERLTSIIDRCTELGLIEQCVQFPPTAATKEQVCALHSPSVYDLLETTHENKDEQYLEELSSKFDAIYVHPSTHSLALISAGSTISMVENIVSGRVQNGAVFVRPPGHHAMRSEPCGYCFYNNVALAAKHALDQLGLKRILIVDWDVHHGQATQQMFYDDPRVVYFSIHRYEQGSFWPNLRQSNYDYIGRGAGRGYNFNVPLNKTGMGDGDYLAIWHQLLLPMAFEFSPQLILISAGFDSALGDEKGEMCVTPACYATLCHLLMCACTSVCVVLEGGYCLGSLAEAAALSLRALLGLPTPLLQPLTPPSDEIRETILNCIYVHKPYWSCYNFQDIYSLDGVPNVCDGAKEKHTVVVKWEGDETRPDKFDTRNCYPLQDNKTKAEIQQKLNFLRIATDLSVPENEVCYLYDPAMLKHKNIREPDHVECPERIQRIHERHRDYGLLSRVKTLNARRATREELLMVHTEEHIRRLEELATTKPRDLIAQGDKFDSLYFHPDSYESATTAVGCVLEAVEAVVSGTSSSAVCVVRPPGHHAAAALPAGFCLLNAAAAAAAAARLHCRRVLLLDWDVHHGNGTQMITYAEQEILYISIHRYDNGSFFPHSTDANYDMVGEGRGEGFNVNIPWNKRGMGDTEYLTAFTQVILPIAYEYRPDLVIVSAGFDACVGDPLGGCKVTPECYGKMTQLIKGLAGGKVVLCLEGGYNTTSISYAMTMCTKALLGDPIHLQYNPKAICHPSAIESINNVIRTHKKYWKSLKFQLALPIENVLEEPPPSRGLDTEPNISIDISINSLDSAYTSKCSFDSTIESGLANLTIDKPKCSDGIHCGTDDEEDTKKVKTKDASKPGSSADMSQPGSSRSRDKNLVEHLKDSVNALANEEMFAVTPITWCPHLNMLGVMPDGMRFEQGAKCVNCDHTHENWVCLHCYVTACARAINGHMQEHFQTTNHTLALSLVDLSVWCNDCDSYVDNALLYDFKNNAHRCKFGEDMVFYYGVDLRSNECR